MRAPCTRSSCPASARLRRGRGADGTARARELGARSRSRGRADGRLPRRARPRCPRCSRPARCSARAAAVGFDWPELGGPAREGARGARRARGGGRARRAAPRRRPSPTRRCSAEVGDLLFTVVNVARVLNVDPELALRGDERPLRRARRGGRAARRRGGRGLDGARPRRAGAVVPRQAKRRLATARADARVTP